MSLEEYSAVMKKLNMVTDSDEGRDLLQLFTKTMLDKPTVVLEDT